MAQRAFNARLTTAFALAIIAIATAHFAQSAKAALGPATPLSSALALISNNPQVDFDAAGTATAFYYTEEPLAPSGIVARTRTGAGAWGQATEVSTGVAVGSLMADVGADGSAIVAWEKPSDLEVWAAYRSSAGVWSAPFQMRDDGPDSLQPTMSVAIDDNGNCVVAWRATAVPAVPGVQAVYARYRSATTGMWSSIDTVSDTDDFAGNGLELEADSNGNFVAAWLGNATEVVDVATRSAGDAGTWGQPEAPDPPSGPTVLGHPKIAADGGGKVGIVWVRQSSSPAGNFLRFTERPSGGSWSMPVDISSPDTELDRLQSRPQLAFDAAGNAIAAWVDGFAEADRLRAATKAPGGAWAPAETVHDEVGEIHDLSMDVDSTGNATLAWRREDLSDVSRIELINRSPAGAWSAVANQSPSFVPSAPRVASSGDGGAAVVWSSFAAASTPPGIIYARFSAPLAPPNAGPAPHATTPRIGRVTISPKKVYRRARVKGSKKKRRTSAAVQFSLSEPATVTLEFQYRFQGRLIGGKCVRKSRRNIRRRACERISPWGKPITSPAGTGASSISFSAKRLRKGNYYVIVKAKAPSGADATPVRAKMTVG